jgi:hypothetical protein
MAKDSVILCWPDTHIPFEHQDAFSFLSVVKNKYRPNIVVCLGDFEDFHGISMHDHDPDGLSPGDELTLLKKRAKEYFKLFPEVFMCTSNHGSLPFRRAFKFGMPSQLLKSYKDILEAPDGWIWADHWTFDGIMFEHGDPFSGRDAAIKAAEQNMMSTVIGHIHSFAGIQYSANSKHLIFGFNVGCLIDKDKYAFAYAKKNKRKPILGCGIIINGIPTFIPMLLNSKGRWIGKIV